MHNPELLSAKQRFGIIGNSSALNHAIQVAIQVAPTDMTVLITGESGSGKESFSKIIHSLSVRKHGQFIAINCGAIPEGTIDSELFGHEKGAFTGALDSRKGYFEVTNGGTIFLDEIGEMPLQTQARLLRVLENGEYIKVGSSKVLKTDVRVIAATNVDLIKAVEKGKFREDLYYRLNTVPILVPPLRDRGDDIYLLFRKFASDFSEKYRVKPIKLDEEAQNVLLKYRFPGNIRQLKNLVDRISALEMDREIDREKILKYLPTDSQKSLPAIFTKDDPEGFNEREILYKILFDMKNDMNELKQLVFESLKNESYGDEIINDHKDLFNSMNSDLSRAEDLSSKYLLESGSRYSDHQDHQRSEFNSRSETIEVDRVEDVTHEFKDESLSIEEKEKELIILALKKNRNKRKYAAQDLGISERTLYRKIKQYEIGD